MKTNRYPSVSLAGLGVAALVAVMTAYAGNADTMETSEDSPAKPQKTLIENTKKFMLLPPDQRKQQMMKAQKASLVRGEALFNDHRLGANGLTCANCHVGGGTGGKVAIVPGMDIEIPSLRGVAATFPKYKAPNDAVITLAEMKNNCIVMFMEGKPIPLGNQKFRDLAAYVSSLK